MRDFLASRTPSPAMAVAFVALLAALSGTAIALPGKNTIDKNDLKKGAVRTKALAKNAVTGAKIKNGAVGTRDIRNNSVTGTDVNESTLGEVPSANSANTANNANSADSADTANTANSLNGVVLRRFHYESGASATPTTLLDVNGLRITATCTGGALSVRASTTVPNSSLRGYGVQHGSFAPAFTNNVEEESANAGFQPGENVELVPTLQNDVRNYLVYYNNDSTINVEYTTDEPGGGPTGTTFACVATGHAIAS